MKERKRQRLLEQHIKNLMIEELIEELIETKKDAYELRGVCYPQCKEECIFIHLDGYECESICPSKFKEVRI